MATDKQDKQTKDFKDPFAYEPKDDIYNKGKKVASLDEDGTMVVDDELPNVNPSKKIVGKQKSNAQTNIEGQGLDVPGSELDDQMENIGSEDEENNYYSLGGDNHDD